MSEYGWVVPVLGAVGTAAFAGLATYAYEAWFCPRTRALKRMEKEEQRKRINALEGERLLYGEGPTIYRKS